MQARIRPDELLETVHQAIAVIVRTGVGPAVIVGVIRLGVGVTVVLVEVSQTIAITIQCGYGNVLDLVRGFGRLVRGVDHLVRVRHLVRIHAQAEHIHPPVREPINIAVEQPQQIGILSTEVHIAERIAPIQLVLIVLGALATVIKCVVGHQVLVRVDRGDIRHIPAAATTTKGNLLRDPLEEERLAAVRVSTRMELGIEDRSGTGVETKRHRPIARIILILKDHIHARVINRYDAVPC